MKKNEVDIEKLFQRRFLGAELKPHSDLWSKINSQLEFKRKIKFLQKIILGIILIGVSLLVINRTFVSKTQSMENESIVANDLSLKKSKEITKETTQTQVRERLNFPVGKKINPKEQKTSEKIPTIKPNEVKIVRMDKEAEVLDSMSTKEIVQTTKLMPKLEISQKQGCEPLKVQITIKNSNNTIFFIDFGDGEGIRSNKIDHEYLQAGTYIIRLKKNKIILSVDTIIVYPKPIYSSVSNLKQSYLSGEKLNLSTLLLPDENCKWYIGNILLTKKQVDIRLQKEGYYPVSLVKWTNKNCKDSFFLSSITVQAQNYKVQFPNAFRPDPQGEPDSRYNPEIRNNQIFYPILEGVQEITIKIYNRNSVLVFESKDPDVGWNGYYKHHLMPQDVYIWKAEGIYLNGEEFLLVGDLTLIY